MLKTWLGVFGCSLIAASHAHAAQMPSVHAREVAAHANDPEPDPSEVQQQQAQVLRTDTQTPARKLNRIVYGYLPTWESRKNPTIKWDLLTHLSFFNIEVNGSGDIVSFSPLTNKTWNYEKLRDEAKANGVKFTITVTNFNDSQIATIVTTHKTKTINAFIKMVKDYGAEGINVDYEFVPKSVKAAFVTYMDELTTRMHAEIPGSHVTIAGPSIDYQGAYDYDQLLSKSDGIMIMYYGCHWSGSSRAGPNAPLSAGSIWNSKCTLPWVVDDYYKYGLEENRGKVIMGLPFYGNRWWTVDDAVPSNTIETSNADAHSAVFFRDCKTRYATKRLWDTHSQTPYTTYQSNGRTTQLWCDDGESWDLKLKYLVQRDVGGVGIWALNYEGEHNEIWDAIRTNLTEEDSPEEPGEPVDQAPVANAGPAQSVAVGTEVTLDGSQSYDPEGKPLTYLWNKIAGPPANLANPETATPSFRPAVAGVYRFALVVNDGALTSMRSETQVTVGDAPEPEEPPTETPETPAEPQQEEVEADNGQGCACGNTGMTGGLEAGLGALAVLALLRRRRRA